MLRIAGIIGAGQPEHREAQLSAMLERMGQHSYEQRGTRVESNLELWSGWVGHKDDCIHQPAWNVEKDVCLLFTGEHFTDHSECDGRSALNLYLKRGMSFLEELNGLFSGLLIDLRERRVVVFNDRFGISR